MNPVITPKEIAHLLKVSVRQVQVMAVAGKLPGFRVGKQWRFRTTDIAAWLETQIPTRPARSADYHPRTAK